MTVKIIGVMIITKTSVIRVTVNLIVKLIAAKSQHNATAAVKRRFVTMSLYLKEYFIAIKRSTEISAK